MHIGLDWHATPAACTLRYKFCMRLNQERSGARYVLTREVVWDLHIGHPDPAMHDNVKENETQALWAYVHLVRCDEGPARSGWG